MGVPEKLKRFAEAFPDEDALRLALFELLSRIPGISDVRLNHGSRELGMDILFREQGIFRNELVACAAKNTKITGSVSQSAGANNILFQAKQALTAGVQTLNGTLDKVDKVIVACPHECPAETTASIFGELQERRERVTFIVGSTLLQMFSTYYPEFLAQQSSTFGAYVKSIEEELKAGSPVDSVLLNYGLSSARQPASAVYIQPEFLCEISTYKAAVSVPNVKNLEKPVREIEVVKFQRDLHRLTDLLDAANPVSSNSRNLSHDAAKLTPGLRSLWRQGYVTLQKEAEQRGGHTQLSKAAASVSLDTDDEVFRRLALLSIECQLAFDVFSRTLEQSNAFACQPMNGDSARYLQEAARNHVFFISSVTRLVPDLLEKMATTHIVSATFDEATRTSPKLLIAAPAGFGKTTFCNRHLMTDLEEFRQGKSRTIPVFVPAHRLVDGKLNDFPKTILKSADLISLWNDRKASGLRFRLYVDGLDEIANADRQAELMNFIGEMANVEPELEIVATGRDHVAGSFLSDYVRLRVREMNDQKVALFVTSWVRNDKELVADFFGQLEQSRQLKEVIRVPLLATLVLSMFDNSRTLPQSRVSLYNAFVSLLAGGWDVAKRIQKSGQYGFSPKLSVLTRLAADLHLGRKRDFVRADFRAAVLNTVPALEDDLDTLLAEIVQDSLIVRVGSAYIFSHLSYQEFLAAKNLMQPSEHRVRQALGDFLGGDDWWQDVLIFYIGLLGQPKEIDELVHKGVEAYMSRNSDFGVVARAHYLLEGMMVMIPGCRPSFDFRAASATH